jgi:tetratricopeptide (TPR) repeat protein
MLKEDFVDSARKRYEEAAFELEKALRINRGCLFARINLGVLYEDQRRWKEARREYRKILQITPEDEHIRKRWERIS